MFLNRSNAEEIAGSMVELGGMAAVAAQLRGGIADADGALQAAGAHYLKRLSELQDLRRTQSAMAATRHVRWFRGCM